MPAGEGTSRGRSWDRQPKESQQAYGAFHAWLGQVQRNVAALARELGLSPSLLWRWHKRHRWTERALDFDREMERQQEADLRRYRLEVTERRQRRAEETDSAGRFLLRRGLQADLNNRETRRAGETALRQSERFLRLATDTEDRTLAGVDPQAAPGGLERDPSLMDDDILRWLAEYGKDQQQTEDRDKEADDGADETGRK